MKTAGSAIDQFAAQLCRAMSDVFTRTLATEWQFAPAEEGDTQSDGVCVEAARSANGAKLAIVLNSDDASRIVAGILGEAPEAGKPLSGDDAQMVESMLQEAGTSVLSGLRDKLSDMQLAAGSTPIIWEVTRRIILRGSQGADRATVVVHLNNELNKLLAESQPSSGNEPIAVADAEIRKPHDVNLALIMDVELGLTLRFGRRQMTLKEIGELAAGSIIELDKEVQEAVDLLLDDKVIARGEVVIVDGNYGLRVTDICDPS